MNLRSKYSFTFIEVLNKTKIRYSKVSSYNILKILYPSDPPNKYTFDPSIAEE